MDVQHLCDITNLEHLVLRVISKHLSVPNLLVVFDNHKVSLFAYF